MNGSSDRTRRLLEQVAQGRRHADQAWRSAIRQALASDVSVEHVALWAETSVDDVLAIVNDLHTQRRVPAPRAKGDDHVSS
jgi:hypothetical protein